MTHLSTLLALGAAVALMSPIGHAQIAPGGPGHLKKFDLKVEIVVDPGYAPLIVPPGTVKSTSPVGIINCPWPSSGTANTSTNDCSQLGLPSNSNFTLQRFTTPPTNAYFVKWMDIGLPGAMSISNCTSPMAPSITCSMAGLRAIRAVYKCNDHYQYNAHSQTCEDTGKPGSLEVTKQVIVAVGSPPPPANTPFQITVACTPGGPTPVPFTLTVPGNPTHLVNNIAASKVCNIAEAPPPVDPYYLKLGCGWTTSYPGGQSVTMTNPASAMSGAIVNRWSCKDHGPGGHLTVNKVIVNTTGGSAPMPPTFDVAAQCMLGSTNTLNVTLPVPSNSGLSAAPLIAVGSICSISEGFFPKIPNLKQCKGATASWTSSWSGPVTMVAGGATLTATNTLACDKPQEPARFEIRKNTGATVIPGTYVFDLSCTVGNTPVSVTSPVQIVLPGTGFTTISVPSGASCVVTEQSPGTNWNPSPVFAGSGGLTVIPGGGLIATVGPVTGTGGVVTVMNERKPEGAGTVTLKKVLLPTGDPGRFTLQLMNGSLLLANFLNGSGGATMGPVTVPAGTYNVSEVAGTGTNLSNYTSVISGVGCAPDGTVVVANGDAKVCTITNTAVSTACTGWPQVADVNIHNPTTPFGPQSVDICRGGHVTFHNLNSGAARTIQHVSGPTAIPTINLPDNTMASTPALPTAGNQEYQINGFIVHGHIIVH